MTTDCYEASDAKCSIFAICAFLAFIISCIGLASSDKSTGKTGTISRYLYVESEGNDYFAKINGVKHRLIISSKIEKTNLKSTSYRAVSLEVLEEIGIYNHQPYIFVVKINDNRS